MVSSQAAKKVSVGWPENLAGIKLRHNATAAATLLCHFWILEKKKAQPAESVELFCFFGGVLILNLVVQLLLSLLRVYRQGRCLPFSGLLATSIS